MTILNNNKSLNKTAPVQVEGQASSMDSHKHRSISLEQLFQAQKQQQPSAEFWRSFDRKWEKTKGRAFLASSTERIYDQVSSTIVMALPKVQLLGMAMLVILAVVFCSLPRHQASGSNLLASYFQPHENCCFVTEDLSVNSRGFVDRLSLSMDETSAYTKNMLDEPEVLGKGLQSKNYQF